MTDRAGPLSGNRRIFLKAAVAAGGATAISRVSAAPSEEPLSTRSSPDQEAGQQSSGYRESDHIRAYYKTLRE